MKKNFYFLLLLSLFTNLINPFHLQAAEMPKEAFNPTKNVFIKTNGNLRVNEIIIMGNKRTKKSEILHKMNIKPEEYLSEFNPEYLVQKLRRLNLYNEIKINYFLHGQTMVNIKIEVEEKISLIPLPFMRFGGDSQIYGLFVMDHNFLGYHKTFFTGGFWSTEGWNYMLSYMDPSLLSSHFFLHLMSGIGEREFENADIEGSIYRRYYANYDFSSLGLGYKFVNKWKFAILNQYHDYKVDEDYDENIDCPESFKVYKLGSRLEYDNLYFAKLFCYGLKTKIEYLRGFPLEEDREVLGQP